MTADMSVIAPGHWLDTAPAASYLRERADGCPAGITDAGRTTAEQVTLFTDRYTTNYYKSAKTVHHTWAGNVWWRIGTADAAVPGESKHEGGRALDLPPDPEAWVRAHPEYGWRFPIKGEHWHCEYTAALDTKAKTPAPPTPVPAASSPDVPLEVINMRQAIIDIFEHYTGFAPSKGQVQEFTAFWMLNGEKTTAEQIRDSVAGQVAQAFRDELGRNPESPQVVTAYLEQFHGDVAAIRAALAASPEGQAH